MILLLQELMIRELPVPSNIIPHQKISNTTTVVMQLLLVELAP
jgi:hypothetical protein